jgi:hypothetical protein
MILVYIAGPFTAETSEQIEENINRAEELAREIIAQTDRVACLVPHSMGRNFHGPKAVGSAQYWYDATMTMASRCDACLMLRGWERSEGSVREMNMFDDEDLPVFFSVTMLIEWVNERVNK